MSTSTRSIILVSQAQELTDDFIRTFVQEHLVKRYNVFVIEPIGKEFSIQQIRVIKNEVIYSSAEPRLYVLAHFDTASYEAQNAFLKTLEQPPEGVWFVLVVSNANRLLPTIRSRSGITNIVEKKVQGAAPFMLSAALSKLISNGELSVLADPVLSTKSNSDPLKLFDDIIGFFKSRLESDTKSSNVLKQALQIRSVVQSNHVDPQNGIDQLVLAIHKIYKNH